VYYSDSQIRHGSSAEYQLLSAASGAPASKRLDCNAAFLQRERDRTVRVERTSRERLPVHYAQPRYPTGCSVRSYLCARVSMLSPRRICHLPASSLFVNS
jgi:hypothetical protein